MTPAYALVDSATRNIKMDPRTGALAIFDTLESASDEAARASTYTSVEVVPVEVQRAETREDPTP